MATFIVLPQNDQVAETLNTTIPQRFGNHAYALPLGEWLVAYEGTSRQLFEEIGADSVIVLNFNGYWGVASKDIWEWLAVYQK
ncbi:MAG: hypothetical protein LBF93_04340 [Zoogloeaceae bacterium]|jgi:hypothetical protein|nr:hypothetical protein [Zoogloeaceae bacterium]